VLGALFWYGVAAAPGTGSQIRVVPAGFRISISDPTSKVRHPSSATVLESRISKGGATPADTMAV
jgi:hypothetical protein